MASRDQSAPGEVIEAFDFVSFTSGQNEFLATIFINKKCLKISHAAERFDGVVLSTNMSDLGDFEKEHSNHTFSDMVVSAATNPHLLVLISANGQPAFAPGWECAWHFFGLVSPYADDERAGSAFYLRSITSSDLAASAPELGGRRRPRAQLSFAAAVQSRLIACKGAKRRHMFAFTAHFPLFVSVKYRLRDGGVPCDVVVTPIAAIPEQVFHAPDDSTEGLLSPICAFITTSRPYRMAFFSLASGATRDEVRLISQVCAFAPARLERDAVGAARPVALGVFKEVGLPVELARWTPNARHAEKLTVSLHRSSVVFSFGPILGGGEAAQTVLLGASLSFDAAAQRLRPLASACVGPTRSGTNLSQAPREACATQGYEFNARYFVSCVDFLVTHAVVRPSLARYPPGVRRRLDAAHTLRGYFSDAPYGALEFSGYSRAANAARHARTVEKTAFLLALGYGPEDEAPGCLHSALPRGLEVLLFDGVIRTLRGESHSQEGSEDGV
eukprot:gnl/Chilomastix_cuspidata/5482.p1 GENE.gnl/Chilomastix_cuspidata/5482~~gnl/Chilomastix_cuspidata/5482.p1  ORF type:complete len:516 (-),score=187.19 gnl/Chilomastix_cuspidata/5482:315-1817(-)